MPYPHFNNPAANHFLKECTNHSSAFQQEFSIKLKPGQLIDKRILLGFEKQYQSTCQWQLFLEKLNTPSKVVSDFLKSMPNANTLLFAIEEFGNQTTFKVYLEYWEHLISLIQQGKHGKQAFALNKGYKWNTNHPENWIEDTYWCYPMLTVSEIIDRVIPLVAEHPIIFENFLLPGLLKRHGTLGEQLIYLEISAEENCRRSFDINCYKSNLKLGEMTPYLHKICKDWDIEDLFLQSISDYLNCPLGHISGGIDRHKHPFITLYFEI